ncbi:hypothetical protein [Roseibium algae]|uniref:Uncharacterized protein n=1 Tax=Roseibium algae TaxID=3123038 RepID=A0ABU8TIF5_9HYPH
MSAEITRSVIERGDLAHLALFLWAVSASLLAMLLVRELVLSNRRFSEFVAEIARLNRHLNHFVSQLKRDVKPFDDGFKNAAESLQNPKKIMGE